MNRTLPASIVLASALLAGCAGGTPDCGATDTLEVLDRAIKMEVERYAPQARGGNAEEFMGIADTYEITSIRTLDYDKEVDSYQCDALITYIYRGRERSADFEYRVDSDQVDGNVLVEYQKKMLNPIFIYAVGF